MARPPRGPIDPRDRRVAAIFVASVLLFAIVSFAIAFWPRDDDEDEGSPTTTPAVGASPTAVADASPAPTLDVAAAFAAACPTECLVRLDDDAARAALADRGRTPSFAAEDQVWTGLTAHEVDDLRASGIAVAVLAESVETLRLYAIRTKIGQDPAPVRAAGEIVDQVGTQFIVRVPKAPVPVRALIDAGIWVEKFPPILPSTRGEPQRESPVPLTGGEVNDLVWSVDSERIYARIVDLQGMSSSDGTGVGTRHYTSTGNVMAAEYIYTALADYGLRVWYEDFVTDDGLLALNVVGEIPGRDPSQVYLVLAHFDTLNEADLSTSPGADDNATGVAAMLEIARLLSGFELAHPVRFFATNVEEVGLQGVKAFAARAAREGTPIVGAFNLDAVGSAAHGTQIVLNTDENGVWLEDLLIAVNERHGLGQDIWPKVNPNIVADDNFLRDYGVPTVLLARELFGWSTLHHTPADTVETVDLYNVKMAAALVLGSVASLVVVS